MKLARHEIAMIVAVLFAAAPAISVAQVPAKSQAATPSNDALMTQLLALRDSFVNQIKAEGFTPSLPPPQIVIDNPPSYGKYENEKNVLHISSWESLAPDQEARFERLPVLLHSSQTPEQLFEESVHRWIFVHELAHWWQASQHKITADHYAVEYGANRIAAAYWRAKDAAYMTRRTEHFTALVALFPNPVPADQPKEKFFNDNYAKLAGTPVYTWYQASMVVDVSSERPVPSFKQTLE
jgi:hypothetical protein